MANQSPRKLVKYGEYTLQTALEEYITHRQTQWPDDSTIYAEVDAIVEQAKSVCKRVG